jgi:hypothetical protein
MGTIRIACRLLAGIILLSAAPAGAQALAEARAPSPTFVPVTKTIVEERGQGWWLRASTQVRGDARAREDGEAQTSYRFSVQKRLLDHAWLGLGAYGQAPRFDAARGQMRDGRHFAGARLSLEAGDAMEFGFSWMKRIRSRERGQRMQPKAGPRAYVRFQF